MSLETCLQFSGFQISGHGWDGLWVKEQGTYLTIFLTMEHGYGSGYDYHDYDADMNSGMAIFLHGQFEIGKGGLAYGGRIEGSWGIGYVSSLYDPGIVDDAVLA